MTPHPRSEPSSGPSPRILVVDDDRRVRDLLEIALAAQGFGVATARDGEEAVRIALGETVDLVVLDVRLPKKSGLEVCDVLRANADDPWIPIIMVSAASETDARLQGLGRGADDYLGKPFSPKELIARIRRLLARAGEQREARGRADAQTREAQRAREDARRTCVELERVREGRDLVLALAGELLGVSDLDALCRRMLDGVRTRLGTPVAALFLPSRPGGGLAPAAVRGDGFWRIAGLGLDRDGALAGVLAGLGRPVPVTELQRLDRAGAAPFVSARFDLVIPVRDDAGLMGLLAVEERADASAWSVTDLEALAAVSDVGARALRAALGQRAMVEALLDVWQDDGAPSRETAAVAAALERAGGALALPPPLPALLHRAVALLDGGTREAPDALARLAAADTSGLARRLAALIERATGPDHEHEPGDEDRAATLLAAALRFHAARRDGADATDASNRAFPVTDPRLDPGAREAFDAAYAGAPDDAADAA